MALFGTRSAQPNRLGQIQVGTSEYGTAKTIGWGRFKAPIKLLDYQDFNSVKKSQGGKGGGNYQYEYYASIDALVVQGPIGGFGNVYDSGGASALIGAVESYTIPAGGGTYNAGHYGTGFYYDEGVTYQANFSIGANDFGSDGSITLSGSQQVPMARATGAPGARTYTVSTEGAYTFAAADAGTTVTITYAYTTTDTGGDPGSSGFNARPPVLRYNLSVLLGTAPQTAWGYMATAHPTHALRYDGLARVVSENLDLGSSATLPNLSVEVLNGRLCAFGSGISDCDPAAVLVDMLGDPVAGCNWSYLGDLTQYSNFCVANDLFISPFLDSVGKALDALQQITDLTNAAPLWSGYALKIIPYGDTTAVGNGRTFTPATQPVYEIDEDEFLCRSGEEAVKIGQLDLADNYNRVVFEYTNRADNYNTATIHEMDEASILTNGHLPLQTVTAHHFCEKLYATSAMNMLLRRKSTPLRTFEFTLPFHYELLEPMDILVLNLDTGGLGRTPVRIVSIEEDENFERQVVAEDFLWGVAQGVRYPKGSGDGNQPGAHDLPGNTTLLAGFEPTQRLTGGDNELWLALTGGPSWGGCNVWLSLDGTSYGDTPIGRQYGSSRAGTLAAALPGGADPDTANTASVTIAGGDLATVSQVDADAFATLSLLGKELVAYETATLTGASGGTNSYDLRYLRRGVFSSLNQAHNPGEVFVRLDGQIFKYPLDPTLTTRTVFLKFTSLNLYGIEEQALSDVQAYPFALAGAPVNSTMVIVSSAEPATSPAQAQIVIYKYGGGPGDSGTATLPNGTTLTLPYKVFFNLAFSTNYYVNFDPTSTAGDGYVLYTDATLWRAAQQTGLLNIGSVLTLAAPSSGGGTGGGSGSGGPFLPTLFADSGQTATDNPAGAYTAGQQATVSAYAEADSTGDGGGGAGLRTNAQSQAGSGSSSRSTNTGNCSWYGFSGTTAAAATLTVTLAVEVAIDGTGTGTAHLSATLDGTNYSSLAGFNTTTPAAAYTLAVPSGTDLANVRVTASATAIATANNGNSSDSSVAATVSAIEIA